MWLEPFGECILIPSETPIDVIFTEKETSEIAISLDKDNNFTFYKMSQVYIYQNNKVIYPGWKNSKENRGNDSSKEQKSENQNYNFRFINECGLEVTFGIEPFGLYYSIPPKSHLDLFFSQKENDQLIINVDENSSVIIDLCSNVSVYIDDEIYHP